MRFFRINNISDWNDEELLSRYKATEKPEYFGELYSRYIPLVYGLCLKYLQDAGKSEDATMQLFERLLPRINNYEVKIFKTWLYSVAKNHCLQLLREKEREIPVDFNSQFMESDNILHLFYEDENNERLEALKHCMEKLPETQRISIAQFFMDEMSYADIAESTGYQLKSVKSYIQNGKRNLRICIENSVKE